MIESCANDACLHRVDVHHDDGHCRVTGCGCGQFVGLPAVLDETRRLTFDLPAGFAVSVTFMPIGEPDD